MKHELNTPFGNAMVQYDGHDTVYVEFQTITLGPIQAQGTLRLTGTNERFKNFSGRNWRDQTYYPLFNRIPGFMRQLTPGAKKRLRDQVIPWLCNYLDSDRASHIFTSGEKMRIDNEIENLEDTIEKMERELLEKREALADAIERRNVMLSNR